MHELEPDPLATIRTGDTVRMRPAEGVVEGGEGNYQSARDNTILTVSSSSPLRVLWSRRPT